MLLEERQLEDWQDLSYRARWVILRDLKRGGDRTYLAPDHGDSDPDFSDGTFEHAYCREGDLDRYMDQLFGKDFEPPILEADYTQRKEREAERLFASNAWKTVRCRYCPGEPKLEGCMYNHVVGYSPAMERSLIEVKGEP